jgi:glycosyltransferase involved in cell wall biosynthesis
MRVLMLAQSYAPIVGGIEHMVESMSAELAKRGHEVSVATMRQPGADPVGSERVPVHPLGSAVHDIPGLSLDQERHHAPPGPDPRTTLELRRLVKELQPDVVHAHDWLIHSYLPLDRRAEAGLVLSMHDYGLACATKRYMHREAVCSGPETLKCVRCANEVYGGTAKGTTAALGTRASERRMHRHIDVFLPVSNAVREFSRIGPADTCRVVPNFVSEQPEPLADDPSLEQLPDEPFILYFGDVSVQKGVDNLVAAYRELDSPPPLVLIGRRFEGEIEDTAGAVALGRMPHRAVLEALRRSLFGVAPSIWPDPFPVVALETAAAGKPIVASRIGGLQDSVADGESGILVPPGDRAALATALRTLVEDDALRERMGADAEKRQKTLFTPDTVVPQYEEAYELALERRRARHGKR